ncbi:MAG: DUF2207 domain-containing protein, partial [bacterium]
MAETSDWLCRFVAVVVLTTLLSLGWASSSRAREVIHNWHSDLFIRKNGTVKIREHIKFRAEHEEIVHGLTRDIPTVYRDGWFTRRYTEARLLSLRKDGDDYHFYYYDKPWGKRVYLGYSDLELLKGNHTYTFTYEMDHVIRPRGKREVFLWDVVNGRKSHFPIRDLSATLHLPENLTSRDISLNGYLGRPGTDSNKHVSTEVLTPHKIRYSATEPPRNRIFTVGADWPSGKASLISTPDLRSHWYTSRLHLFALLAGAVVVIFYYLLVWVWKGKDPPMETVSPRIQLPDELSPGALRFLDIMGYDDRAFTASLLDLGSKGYIRIESDDGDNFTIHKQISPDGDLPDDQRTLMNELFKYGRDVLEFGPDASPSEKEAISDASENYGEELEAQLLGEYLTKHLSWTWIGFALSGFFLTAVVVLDQWWGGNVTGFERPMVGFLSVIGFLVVLSLYGPQEYRNAKHL